MEGRQEHALCLALQQLGPIKDLIEELEQEPLLPRNGWGPPGIYFPCSVFKAACQMDRSAGEPGSKMERQTCDVLHPPHTPWKGATDLEVSVRSEASVPFPPPSALSS